MSFEDEMEGLKGELRGIKEYLGISQYTPHAYGVAPKASYPLPKLASAIERILGSLKLKKSNTIGDLIEALKGKAEAIEELKEEEREINRALIGLQALPTTKKACEEAGGEWDEETNTCKLPKERETTESLAVLPTRRGAEESRAERRMKQLVRKAKGEE